MSTHINFLQSLLKEEPTLELLQCGIATMEHIEMLHISEVRNCTLVKQNDVLCRGEANSAMLTTLWLYVSATLLDSAELTASVSTLNGLICLLCNSAESNRMAESRALSYKQMSMDILPWIKENGSD